MSYTIQEAFDITHQATKLESAAYARTLTNNPSAGVVAELDDEAAATVALLGGTVVPSTSAVIANAETHTDIALTVNGGSEVLNTTMKFTVVNGKVTEIDITNYTA